MGVLTRKQRAAKRATQGIARKRPHIILPLGCKSIEMGRIQIWITVATQGLGAVLIA
jgi:hypothetical protein